jgi:hypothetical protein
VFKVFVVFDCLFELFGSWKSQCLYSVIVFV